MTDELAGTPQVSGQTAALVHWREQLGLSQLLVATACRIDLSKYSKWERGFAHLQDLQVVAVAEFLYHRAETLARAIPAAQQELGEIKQAVGL